MHCMNPGAISPITYSEHPYCSGRTAGKSSCGRPTPNCQRPLLAVGRARTYDLFCRISVALRYRPAPFLIATARNRLLRFARSKLLVPLREKLDQTVDAALLDLVNLAYRWFCRLGLEDAVPESIDWGRADKQSRAVREYLEALEHSNPVEAHTSEPAASSTPPKKISLTDPAARWTAAPGGPAFFAYSTNYLIDLQAGIIVDVEATPANRSQEVESTRTMIDRVEHQRGLKPRRLVGDTAYGTAALLGWMVEQNTLSHTYQSGTKQRAKTIRSPDVTDRRIGAIPGSA